jgi:hypothetical protein
MSGEYLYLAFVVLLTRALLSSRERPMSLGRLVLSVLLQLASLAAMEKTSAVALVAAAMAAVAVGAFVLEPRGASGNPRDASRNLVRFAAAVLLIVGLSFVGSPGRSGVRFADWALGAAHALAGASVLLGKVDARGLEAALTILSGALFVSIDINNLTRYVLLSLKVAPAAAVGGQDKGETQLRRGKMIGIMERLLIFYFVLTSNLAAIGFVLAAKGFTRFRELDDRDFAEYVLIGTLLSAAGAVLVGIVTRLVLDSL